MSIQPTNCPDIPHSAMERAYNPFADLVMGAIPHVMLLFGRYVPTRKRQDEASSLGITSRLHGMPVLPWKSCAGSSQLIPLFAYDGELGSFTKASQVFAASLVTRRKFVVGKSRDCAPYTEGWSPVGEGMVQKTAPSGRGAITPASPASLIPPSQPAMRCPSREHRTPITRTLSTRSIAFFISRSSCSQIKYPTSRTKCQTLFFD